MHLDASTQVASPTRAHYGKSGDKRRAKNKALMSKIGGGIKNAVGSVLAAPITIPAKMRGEKDTRDAAVMREARKYKGAPSFTSNGAPTDALKMRTAADAARMKRGAKPIY